MKHEKLLAGASNNGTDGVVAVLAAHDATLFGTERNPGGIAKDIQSMKRTMWAVGGLLAGVEFISRFIPLLEIMVKK